MKVETRLMVQKGGRRPTSYPKRDLARARKDIGWYIDKDDDHGFFMPTTFWIEQREVGKWERIDEKVEMNGVEADGAETSG